MNHERMISPKGEIQMKNKQNEKFVPQLEENNVENILNNKDPETHDFDLSKGKKPALSSMKSMLRLLDSNLSRTVQVGSFIQLFDKLKFSINMKQHGEDIEFHLNSDTNNMMESDIPDKVPTKQEYDEHLMRMYLNPSKSFKAEPNIDFREIEEDLSYAVGDNNEDFDNIEFTEDDNNENENLVSEDEVIDTTNTDNLNSYPNCKISYEIYNRTAGIINIYMKNDVLIIYLSGKFMAERASLGYLTRNNIEACLEKVCQITGMSFNVQRALTVAHLYLCDCCIDLYFNHKSDVTKVIRAFSSLFPLASNRYRILKYSSHGLKIISKSKNVGSSLTIYAKTDILKLRGRRSRKLQDYLLTIGEIGRERAEHTLRIECQMYKLNDIRTLLNIPKQESRVLMLTDVLNSTATPILLRLASFEATEDKLREKIWNYIEAEENADTPIRTAKLLRNRLASERIAELTRENDFDITKVKNHLIIEDSIVDETFISSLITQIKSVLWDFLLYNKPKSIKIVLDVIDRIYRFYGRNAGGDNV